MTKTIFITGSTGMIGKELVRHLLDNTDFNLMLLTHLNGKDIDKAELLSSVFGIKKFNEYGNRISIINGDITANDIGLDRESQEAFLKEVSFIIHSAASTKFDLPIDEIRKINVEGTKNIINLALKSDKIEKFSFISTVYVSGKKTGHILETDESHDFGFVNTYEQSKYEAEKLFKSYSTKLPFVIYRLSTVIGDSKTGRVGHFTAPHHALRMMYLGLASMIPGKPDYSVDLIPSDISAKILAELFLHHFKNGETYHIVAGEDKSYTLKLVLEKSYEYLKKYNPQWGNKNYPLPTITSEEAFNLFVTSIEQTGNPLFSKILSVLKHFAHQLNYPKTFDQKNIISAIPEYSKTMPDIDEYYGKVVEFCLRTNWGRL